MLSCLNAVCEACWCVSDVFAADDSRRPASSGVGTSSRSTQHAEAHLSPPEVVVRRQQAPVAQQQKTGRPQERAPVLRQPTTRGLGFIVWHRLW